MKRWTGRKDSVALRVRHGGGDYFDYFLRRQTRTHLRFWLRRSNGINKGAPLTHCALFDTVLRRKKPRG